MTTPPPITVEQALAELAALRAACRGVPMPPFWQATDPEALLYIRATTCADIHALLAAEHRGGDDEP